MTQALSLLFSARFFTGSCDENAQGEHEPRPERSLIPLVCGFVFQPGKSLYSASDLHFTELSCIHIHILDQREKEDVFD
jgi:hypothetical protein